MKLEFVPCSPQHESGSADAGAAGREGDSDPSNKRSEPRHRFTAQAFVAIAGLPSRAYEVREISRGGMFLGFRELRSTLLDFEQNDVETGVAVEVAFAVSRPDGRHQFSVRGTISRITRQGIGVQFTTHNPPQLGALRELFAGASAQRPAAQKGADRGKADAATQVKRQTLAKPADDAAWTDWELLD